MKQRSRTEYSLINMFTGFVGYGVNTITGFLCRIIFVRTLATDYLGISGLFTNILSVLSLAELGISSAITYALYKPIAQDDKKKIASIMHFYRKVYAGIGVFIALAGLTLMPFLKIIVNNAPSIKESIYLLYCLYLLNTVVSYFFSYRSSLLIAMQRQYIVSGYSYVITIAQSFLQIVFLLLTHEYIWYLLIQIFGGILYNVWLSYKTGKDYPYILDKNVSSLTKDETKSLFVNIKALAINKVSGVLVNSTDNIVISFFKGISIVGLSSNYTMLSSLLNTFVTLLFNGMTGSVGNLNANANKEESYQFFRVLNFANFWIYGWAAIGMIFVSSDLVRLFFGNQYVMPSSIPLILAINFFSTGTLHSSYTYKSTLGLFRYGQYLLFFTGIINLFLDVVLGARYGVFGIYLATLIARAFTNLWYEPFAVFKYGFNKSPLLYFKYASIYLLVLTCSSFICWGVCSFCAFSLVTNVILKFIICTIVPNLMFIVCFKNTMELNYLVKKIKMLIVKPSRK